jgi:uncharacterized repeat protein (TIGR01451 family)
VGLFATFASIALLPCGVALADTVATDFENFNAGLSVNGQHNWTSPAPGTISGCSQTGGEMDQRVVTNAPFYPSGITGFGQQSLRLSNACASDSFGQQTFSAPVTDPAGEHQPSTEYTAQFSFITTTSNEQPGLYVNISPDNGSDGRMSFVGLKDIQNSTLVTVADTPLADGEFAFHDVAVLPRGVPHTIKLWIKFNPGSGNDLMRISIDGQDTGQCFTTWENYYPAVSRPVPAVDRLIFRSNVAVPSVAGGGFLFDNVSVTTDNGAGPPGCDVPIEKKADASVVSAGGTDGFRITVRNRGRLSARNLLVCDHIPREMTFVSADRKLRRIGRRRCFVIPRLAPGQRASAHLVVRVNANAAPGTVDNIADVTPMPPPDVPALPPASGAPPPPAPGADVPGKIAEIGAVKAIKIVKAVVKILAKKAVAPTPPPVTG